MGCVVSCNDSNIIVIDHTDPKRCKQLASWHLQGVGWGVGMGVMGMIPNCSGQLAELIVYIIPQE